MKHLGDITKIHGNAVEIVDVVTGGSPCQDLSVAGKRAGLAGERSGLFMEQIRIIKEMRDECERRLYDAGADYNRTDIKPRYMVWENVAGAFSSNKGEDFRAVLEETAKVADKDAYVPGLEGGKWSPCGCILGNGWSIAWRLHDAQYWGVPQRRKRICLLADFNGDTAGKVLFELQRETTNRDTEQAIVDIGAESRSEVQYVSEGMSGDITESGKPGKDAATDVRPGIEETGRAVVYGISAYDSNSMKSSNPNSGIYEAETARTLDLNGGSPACNQGGMAVVYNGAGITSPINASNPKPGDPCHTLTDDSRNYLVQGADMYNGALTGDIAATLNATSGDSPTHSGPSVVCLEGNGSRPSHRGDGYSESETMYTLNSTEHHAVAVENHPADSRVKISEDGMVQTLSGRMGTGGNNVPMVMYPEKTTGSLMASGYDKLGTQEAANDMYVVQNVMAMQAIGEYKESEAASSLKQRDYKDATDLVVASFYPKMKAESQCYREDDVSNTLVNGTNPGFQNGIVTSVDCRNGTENPNINGTLQSKEQGYNTNSNNIVRIYAIVRRLTPFECERLQGFPDYWTDIGDWVDSKGKTHKGDSDSPRYKALGNSIALPFWSWMAGRMVKYLEPGCSMASLFDGIGGFPLVFSSCGCKPVWASEIEEFPIAVTKIRFPEDENGRKNC